MDFTPLLSILLRCVLIALAVVYKHWCHVVSLGANDNVPLTKVLVVFSNQLVWAAAALYCIGVST